MRVPYVVGRWVRGHEHYGRQRLIDYLIRVNDSATWVISTRRMGKTSLLRQLELLTNNAVDGSATSLVPLFWDLQGCESFDDLTYELVCALEDVGERFAPFGIDVHALNGEDAIQMLRKVSKTLAEHNQQLLLLVDEAEALVQIGQNEPKWLARLRKTIQSGYQRTIITSTKLLTQVNELGDEFNTSPFLFGFNLANLQKLDDDAACTLIVQEQSQSPLSVEQSTIDTILNYTNRHAYLTQFLCHRLFEEGPTAQGILRPVEEHDLLPDPILAGFFQVDFQLLTRLEKRILLTIAQRTLAQEADIVAELHDAPPNRIQAFLYSLQTLGYIRPIANATTPGHWLAIGNEFLRRWIQDNFDKLSQQLDSSLSDHSLESLIGLARTHELDNLHREIDLLRTEQTHLELQRTTVAGDSALALAQRIDHVSRQLAGLQQKLAVMSQ